MEGGKVLISKQHFMAKYGKPDDQTMTFLLVLTELERSGANRVINCLFQDKISEHPNN